MERRLHRRSQTSGRADDNTETIRKRLVTHETQSLPTVQRLEQQHLLVRIDGEASEEDVYRRLCNLFEQAGIHQGTSC